MKCHFCPAKREEICSHTWDIPCTCAFVGGVTLSQDLRFAATDTQEVRYDKEELFKTSG